MKQEFTRSEIMDFAMAFSEELGDLTKEFENMPEVKAAFGLAYTHFKAAVVKLMFPKGADE